VKRYLLRPKRALDRRTTARACNDAHHPLKPHVNDRTDHDSLLDALAARRGIRSGAVMSLDLDGEPLDACASCSTRWHPFVSEARRATNRTAVLGGRTRTVTTGRRRHRQPRKRERRHAHGRGARFSGPPRHHGEARFKDSKRTSIGAEKWLDVYDWPTPASCAKALRAAGYRIVVTTSMTQRTPDRSVRLHAAHRHRARK
jgi:hypothetical protein